jgi:UDP:flavonoid glycosyltransferase YjiC (YdhE family)
LKKLSNSKEKSIITGGNIFRIEKGFVPQRAILSHKGVKIFVSHCGANSALEGLTYGKVILGIPYNFDQFDIAARVVDSGTGISVVSYRNFTRFQRDEENIFSPDTVFEKLKL